MEPIHARFLQYLHDLSYTLLHLRVHPLIHLRLALYSPASLAGVGKSGVEKVSEMDPDAESLFSAILSVSIQLTDVRAKG